MKKKTAKNELKKKKKAEKIIRKTALAKTAGPVQVETAVDIGKKFVEKGYKKRESALVALDRAKKKIARKKSSNKKTVIKKFCPACGSTKIIEGKYTYGCMNCNSKFKLPKISRIKLEKKPKYVG